MTPHEEHREKLKKERDKKYNYPDCFSGRGIVICGGSQKYFTCAWVCIKMLRHVGCLLPIELWFLGEKEMTKEMQEIANLLDVECVDATKVREKFPARILNGWELKPYSILHSKFKEVMLIDSDNVVTKDPTFLFDNDNYKKTGSIFWPDYNRLSDKREIWNICDVKYNDEPEFESGQIVVDKEKCWKSLNITMHLNEYSDFYYHYIHGDKETFHMGWRINNQQYSMPPFEIYSLDGVMCQHDFNRNIIFQHRNMHKWSLYGDNPRIDGFLYEEECLKYLDELRLLWAQKFLNHTTEKELEIYKEICGIKKFLYVRVGHDSRILEFLKDNKIGDGSDKCERMWRIRINDNSNPELVIYSDTGITCSLSKSHNGSWNGRWESFEKMPILLIPAE